MFDMFLILKATYFTGYPDDNTQLVVNIEDVIKALEDIGEKFSNNEMKLNTVKCHLIINSQEEPNTLKVGDLHINSESEKLLSITFDLS